jgi:putative DNA primase/helicase
MKLRAQGFSLKKGTELVGTIIALSDAGEPLGVEHAGNYSRDGEKGLLKKLELLGTDPKAAMLQLRQLLTELREVADAATTEIQQAKEAQRTCPIVRVDKRFLREIAEEAWQTLESANDPPLVFQRGHLIVDIINDDKGLPLLRTLDRTAFKGILDRVADFVKLDKDGVKPARPPADVVADMMASKALPLPLLQGIIRAPILSPSGILATNPGYQPETQCYLLGQGLLIPEVPLSPDNDDLASARSLLLDELLVDFRFVSDADLAHAVAVLLLPFVRLMIDGPTPLYLVESPTPGSGKGLLVDVLAIPAAGQAPSVMTEGRDEDEWRKRITAKLLQGPQFILIDNIRSRLDSAALSAALTSEIWEDRVLGHSRTAAIPVVCVWLATANNPGLSLEVARRTVAIRLDSGIEKPWQRQGFRHPKLRHWARQHRGQLIWAALTLIQAWITAGKPAGQQSLGSYESWAEVVGGILEVASIPGFLGNLDRVYAEADQEVLAWGQFYAAWWREFQQHLVTADSLFKLATEHQLLMEVWAGRDAHGARTAFGKALARMRDRVVASFRARRVGEDSHTKVISYRLELVEKTQSPAPVAGVFPTRKNAAQKTAPLPQARWP